MPDSGLYRRLRRILLAAARQQRAALAAGGRSEHARELLTLRLAMATLRRARRQEAEAHAWRRFAETGALAPAARQGDVGAALTKPNNGFSVSPCRPW